MVMVAIVSPGAMGSALGRGYVEGGARVVACVAGRSERTRPLADGLDLVDSLDPGPETETGGPPHPRPAPRPRGGGQPVPTRRASSAAISCGSRPSVSTSCPTRR